jgi:hypothetical protein
MTNHPEIPDSSTRIDLAGRLAVVDQIAKHWRLETGLRKGRRYYRLNLWTKTSRRVSGVGPTPMAAVEAAVRNLKKPGRQNKPDGYTPVSDDVRVGDQPPTPRLRLTT